MLYRAADRGPSMRVQGAYISDEEIERLVKFWSRNTLHTLEQIAVSDLNAPKGEDDEEENDDKLLVEATKVVREYRRASVSLLQRRLSIGYSRAARLLDQLEDRGVVGPSEDGRSRVVFDPGGNELTAIAPSFESDDPALINKHAPISASAPSSAGPAVPTAQGRPLGLYNAPSTSTSLQPLSPRPGHSIQVSARILTWPRLCACCSRPATTDVAASYTRVSGKRVIRTNTRSWRVPVCATCAEHDIIYSRTIGATARAIAWGVAILVVACAVGAAAGSPDGGINPAFVVLGAIGAVALLIVLLRRAQADQRTAEGMLQDTCCSVAYPVVYQGWSGSVHSFFFRNGVYAQAFVDANAKEVL